MKLKNNSGSVKTIIIFIILIILLIGGFLFYYFYFQKPKEPPTDLKLTKPGNMKLISPAFENNQLIPSKYTCDGEDINPPLEISEVPEGTQGLVLIVDDPDAPMGTWTHWIVWNINPSTTLIEENSVPEGAFQGMNNFGKQPYGGPCPPSGTHRYQFKLYALDTKLELNPLSDKKNIEEAMENHIIEETMLVGLYKHQ